jgi:hypothetical protein
MTGKIIGILVGLIMIFSGVFIGWKVITDTITTTYDYNREIGSNWDLSVKASTIAKKSEYLDKFVKALDKPEFHGQYNALFFPTPNNSFDSNFEALKSLQTRLEAIKSMDENSFAYQTAIQQITAQEQDEAGEMLGVFGGIYWKQNAYWLWHPIYGLLAWLSIIALPILGGIVISATAQDSY